MNNFQRVFMMYLLTYTQFTNKFSSAEELENFRYKFKIENLRVSDTLSFYLVREYKTENALIIL